MIDAAFKEAEEYEGCSLTPEGVQASDDQAEANGFTVVKGEPNKLLLDLDTTERCDPEMLDKIKTHFGIMKVEGWHSKSGNMHTVITLRTRLTVPERIALQAILGSDPVRELLTLVRHINYEVEEPSRLYKPGA